MKPNLSFFLRITSIAGVVAIVAASLHGTAGAEVFHPETAFGDFADTDAVPASDLGAFLPELHVITGVFGDDGSNNDDGDIEILREFSVESGETIDLGELTVKLTLTVG